MDIDEIKRLDATEPKYDPVTGLISFYEGGKKFEITKEALIEKKKRDITLKDLNDLKEISRQRDNQRFLEKGKKQGFYIVDNLTGVETKLDKEEQVKILKQIENDMEKEKQHWVKVK